MRYAEICFDVDAADADRAEGALVLAGFAVEVRDQTTLLKPPAGRAHLVVYAEPEGAAERADEAMRALLEKLGHEPNGRIDSFDDGASSLIYVKHLQ